MGFLWILAWRALYYPPDSHPRISAAEREMLLKSRESEQHTEAQAIRPGEAASMGSLLRLRQTWGIIMGRFLTDPVWFFVSDWFAIYLVSKGFNLESTLIGFWVPFLAADLGNFFGGGVSSYLIRRGWPVLAARKAVIVGCGFAMTLLIPAVFASSFVVIISLFAISTFAYAAWSTMALSLPSDLYPSRSVASVSGMSGTGAGVGTIISTYLIGWTADRYSFEPVLIAGSLIPLVATAFVLLLVRPKHSGTAGEPMRS
jgi:ACS family hexuronate transporter-like MFS transporter